jgi:hypothetical protein
MKRRRKQPPPHTALGMTGVGKLRAAHPPCAGPFPNKMPKNLARQEQTGCDPRFLGLSELGKSPWIGTLSFVVEIGNRISTASPHPSNPKTKNWKPAIEGGVVFPVPDPKAQVHFTPPCPRLANSSLVLSPSIQSSSFFPSLRPHHTILPHLDFGTRRLGQVPSSLPLPLTRPCLVIRGALLRSFFFLQ